MPPSPEDAATAYHEAGHAVVALALGQPVHRVSVRPKEQWLGRCEFQKGRIRSAHDPVETQILIMLGGLAAEARHTGHYALDGAARDLWAVRSLTERRAAGAKQVDRLERRMLDKTEHLLDQPGMWEAVESIAEELLCRTEISGRAARHLFDQAVRRV
ncbi:MAG: cell division protein FtsH [Planctomycetota bacterium]|nr:cell division protein FtsH [Planctomycetaceae bacterium]MDQ3330511.1 cell division protein FtsH [Planctomycetota bacterium]